jgi:hypothetical protein
MNLISKYLPICHWNQWSEALYDIHDISWHGSSSSFLLFSFCSLIFVSLSLFFYSSSSSAVRYSKMAVALPKTFSTWERMWWLREHRTAVVTVHSIIYHHLDSYTTYRTKRNRNCVAVYFFSSSTIIIFEYVLFNEFFFELIFSRVCFYFIVF